METFSDLMDNLTLAILDAKDSGKIIQFQDAYNLPIKEPILALEKVKKIDKQIINFYKMFDGFKFSWVADTKGKIGGEMHFLKMEEVLQDWKGNLYDEEDIEQNDMIEFFHPFDLITPEAQCGIMIGMEYEDNEIYFNESPTSDTYGLDVDFSGYIEMAKEARVFFYWPKVLIDIQNGDESIESQTFKEHMSKIFPEFNWKNFVEKYNSIRLSAQ